MNHVQEHGDQYETSPNNRHTIEYDTCSKHRGFIIMKHVAVTAPNHSLSPGKSQLPYRECYEANRAK
jgi:hypothetical protein